MAGHLNELISTLLLSTIKCCGNAYPSLGDLGKFQGLEDRNAFLFSRGSDVLTFVSSLPHALKIREPQNDLILIQVWEEALP